MHQKSLWTIVVFTIWSIVSCTSTPGVQPPTEVPQPPAPILGPITPTGAAEIRDLSPTTEVVSNCGAGGGTIIKHPSMSVFTNHAVEWEVGGTTGVGIVIGEGVVPGGISLASTLEGRYHTGLDQGLQQTTAWELPAEPETVVEYTVMWREVWQPAYIEITLADASVLRVNLHYRTGVQSDIIGKRVESCGVNVVTETEPPSANAPSAPIVEATVTQTLFIPDPSPTLVPVVPTQTPTAQPTRFVCTFPSGQPITSNSLSEVIGGEAAHWTLNEATCVASYMNKGIDSTFRHPGGGTLLTYWMGFPPPRNAGECEMGETTFEGGATRTLRCPTAGAEFEADGVGFHALR